MNDELDLKYMRRCIELAKTAEGRTSPNPLVGAVILDSQGELAGEGFHPKAGEAHAEVFALAKAGERARGGTLYVNLEPCSHHGRTPPCADKLIESGITRVVLGLQDPNPKVCGQGISKLKAAGIKVEFSQIESECRELNRAFIKYISTGMPWLALKMAATLDGRIADRHGKSRWISGPESRRYVQSLRNVYDCVLIGGTTAVIDDPELSVREIEGGRDPHRAVMDPSLQVGPGARLCRHKEEGNAWTAIFSVYEKINKAPKYPDRVKLVDSTVTESAGMSPLKSTLRWLADHEVQSVLCEGGGRLAAACLEEGLVDEVFWIIAPKFFIDYLAVPSLAGHLQVSVEQSLELEDVSYMQLGEDMLVRGRLKHEGGASK